MNKDEQPLKLVQSVKIRWNIFHGLDHLRWPVVAVLGDKNVVSLSESNTLDMKEENWQLMSDLSLLPVLQPLQIVTSLLSAEQSPSVSMIFLTMWKLVTDNLATDPAN